jgi:prophage regulatory protein
MQNSVLTDTFVPFSVVKTTTGLSRSTIYEKIGERTFPAPVKIGRASRWSTLELQHWMDAVRAQRGLAA